MMRYFWLAMIVMAFSAGSARAAEAPLTLTLAADVEAARPNDAVPVRVRLSTARPEAQVVVQISADGAAPRRASSASGSCTVGASVICSLVARAGVPAEIAVELVVPGGAAPGAQIVITALAQDDVGGTAASDPARVTVLAAPPDQPQAQTTAAPQATASLPDRPQATAVPQLSPPEATQGSAPAATKVSPPKATRATAPQGDGVITFDAAPAMTAQATQTPQATPPAQGDTVTFDAGAPSSPLPPSSPPPPTAIPPAVPAVVAPTAAVAPAGIIAPAVVAAPPAAAPQALPAMQLPQTIATSPLTWGGALVLMLALTLRGMRRVNIAMRGFGQVGDLIAEMTVLMRARKLNRRARAITARTGETERLGP